MSKKYKVNANLSKISVTAKSTLHDVKASCPGLEGELWGDLSNLTRTGGGSLKLDIRRFSSGDRVRDFAVRTHIDVAKFPDALLSDLKILSTEGAPGDLRVIWEGVVRYRFKSPKVQGQARIRDEGGRIVVEASFPLHLKEVNVEPPKLLFLKVSEEIQIDVKLEALPLASQ